jgi:hypothetical protein
MESFFMFFLKKLVTPITMRHLGAHVTVIHARLIENVILVTW